MNHQKITLEIPPLTDESAAALQCFLNQLMYAVDEHHYAQIQRHYLHSLRQNGTLVHVKEELTNPPS